MLGLINPWSSTGCSSTCLAAMNTIIPLKTAPSNDDDGGSDDDNDDQDFDDDNDTTHGSKVV